MRQAEEFTNSLLALGFSQYEARCYVGLLGPEPLTGYAVAKATGVPQPKVYENLRKLVARGAARQLGGEPVRFLAVPPAKLLDDLESTFSDQVNLARTSSIALTAPEPPPEQELVYRLSDRNQIIAAATDALLRSTRRVYLSASAGELRQLRRPIEHAAETGVDIVVLCFGRMPFTVPGLRVFRHASTDGALYRSHQARHVALVSDSRMTLFGLAADGQGWSGVQTSSVAIIAAVKGYIRHDIDMQQVFTDFENELVSAYGPGLQGLESYRATGERHGSAPDRPAEQIQDENADRNSKAG